MAQIDIFIKSMVRFGARGIGLASDRKVGLIFENGLRFANQSISHQDLVSLVLEVASADGTANLRQRRPASFEYGFAGKEFSVDVQPAPSAWKVTIAPLPMVEELAEPTPRPSEIRGTAATGSHASIKVSTGAGVIEMEATGGVLDQLLAMVAETDASDLHMVAGCRPYLRVHGEMVRLSDFPRFTAQTLADQLDAITPEKNKKEYARHNDTDFAFAVQKSARYRVNRFKDRRGPGAVLRTVPLEILTPDKLGLPTGVLDLCNLTKGLVVITGPTGSGKSTTLASLIDLMNRTRRDHIITIEDPIEFIHDNKRCLVNQRQVRLHTDSFKDALRAALREDPDIVMVGEMRDLETVAMAVETAETGHLVLGTLHTTTAPATVDRIIDQFPSGRQQQVREMLADTLRGVVAQTLCRRVGGGRVAAYEVLLSSPAVANLIRERKSYQLFSLMQTNRKKGMRTLNDSLAQLVRKKLVEPQEALRKAVNRDELEATLRRVGVPVPARTEERAAS